MAYEQMLEGRLKEILFRHSDRIRNQGPVFVISHPRVLAREAPREERAICGPPEVRAFSCVNGTGLRCKCILRQK
jgi:hypothetical protein